MMPTHATVPYAAGSPIQVCANARNPRTPSPAVHLGKTPVRQIAYDVANISDRRADLAVVVEPHRQRQERPNDLDGDEVAESGNDGRYRDLGREAGRCQRDEDRAAEQRHVDRGLRSKGGPQDRHQNRDEDDAEEQVRQRNDPVCGDEGLGFRVVTRQLGGGVRQLR